MFSNSSGSGSNSLDAMLFSSLSYSNRTSLSNSFALIRYSFMPFVAETWSVLPVESKTQKKMSTLVCFDLLVLLVLIC